MTQTPYTADQLLAKAAHYCAAVETCCSAVRQKLHDWGASTDEADRILQQLQQEHYIDDRRFALAFVASKLRYQHWGRIKIRQQLQLKNIDRQIIDHALSTIDNDEYLDILRTLAIKKIKTVHDDNPLPKIVAYLASRGFETHHAYDIANSLIEQQPDDD